VAFWSNREKADAVSYWPGKGSDGVRGCGFCAYFRGVGASLVEGEALLDLSAEDLSELGRRRVREAVDARRDRALVGKEARDASLVLGAGTADEGRMVDQTVLGRVTLGLERTEQGLLGSEDLDGRGRVL